MRPTQPDPHFTPQQNTVLLEPQCVLHWTQCNFLCGEWDKIWT